MNRAVLVYTLCAFLSGSWLESVDAQFSIGHDSWSIIQFIETLSKVVEGLQAEIKVQSSVLNNLVSKEELESILLNNLATKSDTLMQETSLKSLEAKAPTTSDGVDTLAQAINNSTASKAIVEGIIAGADSGVVIIPLDSREQITISSTYTWGVAFNWQSRKVYWIEHRVGIKVANIDGSHAEILISDTSLLCRGLAVDHITGNIYYGKQDVIIRVCDSMGKKCVTVTSGVNSVGYNIRDIALLPSEGLMFWSSPHHKPIVHRANMDGTNATTIIEENVQGLYLDEFTQKLYWANFHAKSIGQRDLNGYNRNVLLNTTMHPRDIAVDGDTLYFGGYHYNGRLSGVYSVTSNGQVSSIANTIGNVYHIALFGRNKVSSRPNPCINSPCANLCVLNRVSYTCL